MRVMTIHKKNMEDAEGEKHQVMLSKRVPNHIGPNSIFSILTGPAAKLHEVTDAVYHTESRAASLSLFAC